MDVLRLCASIDYCRDIDSLTIMFTYLQETRVENLDNPEENEKTDDKGVITHKIDQICRVFYQRTDKTVDN